jgi:hypothetical protein
MATLIKNCYVIGLMVMDGINGLLMATLSLLRTINIPSITINKPIIEFLNDEVTTNNHYAMDEF